MTVFKTASELAGKAVVKPVSKRAQEWAKQAEFIKTLAEREGEYALWPREYTSLSTAQSAAATMTHRRMYSFRECGLPGGFDTIITNDDGRFQIWVAYDHSKQQEEGEV